MSNWHDTILDFIASDFAAFKDGYIEGETAPCLCVYMRDECERSARIEVKKAWGNYVHSGDTSLLVTKLASLLLGYSKLHKLPNLVPLVGQPKKGESPRQANTRIRKVLSEVADGMRSARIAALDERQLCAIARDVYEVASGDNGRCGTLMEYYWDARAAGQALGTEQDRQAFAQRLEKCCKSLKVAIPETQVYASQRDEVFEHAYRTALVKDGTEWLSNKGVSATGARTASVKHVENIPLGLVQVCVEENPDLALALGIRGAGSSSRGRVLPQEERNSLLRDIATMYLRLREENLTDACVPAAIDPRTGMGLYILGSDFAGELIENNDAYVLAIMRPRNIDSTIWSGLEVAGKKAKVLASGKTADLNSPWDYIVRFWTMDEHMQKNEAGTKALASTVKSAYAEFEEMSFSDALEGFRNLNILRPEGCPERFWEFFASDWG